MDAELLSDETHGVGSFFHEARTTAVYREVKIVLGADSHRRRAVQFFNVKMSRNPSLRGFSRSTGALRMNSQRRVPAGKDRERTAEDHGLFAFLEACGGDATLFPVTKKCAMFDK